MDVSFFNRSEIVFFPLDTDGYLTPPVGGINEVDGINQLVLTALVKECQSFFKENLVSIYFRGSQLINTSESDFDTVVVVEHAEKNDSNNLSLHLNNKFRRTFLHIVNFDTAVFCKKDVFNDRHLQFVLKVLSINVFGTALEASFEGFKPDSELIFNLPRLHEKFNWFKSHELLQSNSSRYSAVNYMSKFLLRSAFELVICQEKQFTRNINACHTIFSKYYPAYSAISGSILNAFNNRSLAYGAFLTSAEHFKEILEKEYSKVNINYGTNEFNK